jgi:hypothetical protein
VGLKPIKQGFQEFKINPDFRFGLDDMNFKYQSHYGSIEIHWKKKEEKYIISIKVPFNTTAHLTLEDQLQLLEPGEYLFEIEDRSTNGSNCISR